MQISEIVFSPTGGTRKAADILACGLGSQPDVIDLAAPPTAVKPRSLPPDGLAVIAVPSFGGRVPALAAERLLTLQGNGCPAVLVVVYGNRAYDDTLRELQDIAERAGCRPFAAVAAVAEHSIVHQYAPGRPDREDAAELKQFAEQIRQRVETGISVSLTVPGNKPAGQSKGMSMAPKGSKKCRKCGVCADQCPAGAIDRRSLRKTDKQRCIACMRCVECCPEHARNLNPLMLKAAGLMLRKACSVRKPNELFMA